MSFHRGLHGYSNKRITETDIIELKLTMTYAQLYKFPTNSIYLDIEKAYDKVNRKNLLQLLKHYGLGDTTLEIIKEYWRKQRCVIKNGKYYSKQFTPTEGVTQGDILSPTFFNIIVDSILKKLDVEMQYNPYLKIKTASLFYADDGAIVGSDPLEIQELFDRLIGHFRMYDLFPNIKKLSL